MPRYRMDARVKPAHDSGESGANKLETTLAETDTARNVSGPWTRSAHSAPLFDLDAGFGHDLAPARHIGADELGVFRAADVGNIGAVLLPGCLDGRERHRRL